jgi:hypothetical protein
LEYFPYLNPLAILFGIKQPRRCITLVRPEGSRLFLVDDPVHVAVCGRSITCWLESTDNVADSGGEIDYTVCILLLDTY